MLHISLDTWNISLWSKWDNAEFRYYMQIPTNSDGLKCKTYKNMKQTINFVTTKIRPKFDSSSTLKFCSSLFGLLVSLSFRLLINALNNWISLLFLGHLRAKIVNKIWLVWGKRSSQKCVAIFFTDCHFNKSPSWRNFNFRISLNFIVPLITPTLMIFQYEVTCNKSKQCLNAYVEIELHNISIVFSFVWAFSR